jgi:tetratricopeptide (TPR) repeat protein
MVMRAALELFSNRQYAGVVAVCEGAIDDDPDNLHLRILHARALLALRLDAEAQRVISDCLQRAPRCADAYRLLGELALRRDELKSAEIFVRESLRLDPLNDEARDLLGIILSSLQPTAAVEQLPAATAAVGCPSPAPPGAGRLALGTQSEQQAITRFGDYLVSIGALTEVQLNAALAYHRSVGVKLGTAAATLGFISQPKVEWAAHGFHGQRPSRPGRR